jgi:hypothetical protein
MNKICRTKRICKGMAIVPAIENPIVNRSQVLYLEKNLGFPMYMTDKVIIKAPIT